MRARARACVCVRVHVCVRVWGRPWEGHGAAMGQPWGRPWGRPWGGHGAAMGAAMARPWGQPWGQPWVGQGSAMGRPWGRPRGWPWGGHWAATCARTTYTKKFQLFSRPGRDSERKKVRNFFSAWEGEGETQSPGHKILEGGHRLPPASSRTARSLLFNFTRGSFTRLTDVFTGHELCVSLGFPEARIRHFLL